MVFKSINPYNLQVLAEYPLLEERQLDDKLKLSENAFEQWATSSLPSRALLFQRLAMGLRKEKEELAKLMTLEMGKPILESRAEIEKCALTCLYYAEHGESILQPETMGMEGVHSQVSFLPTGAVFAVMPWNFPFWQVFRYAVPTLIAGNVTLLKHAPNVCGCALALEKVFREADFPEGVFQTVIIDIPLVEKIIQSEIVQGVTLTGSGMAGASVASLAGKHMKKTVLELGGSDPFIVLEDADLSLASDMAVKSRFQNAGQSCIAAKRFIVAEKVKEEFLQRVVGQCEKLKAGNPLDESTTLGPLARLDLAEKVEAQYQATVQQGAKVLLENKREGCKMAPMLVSDFPLSASVFNEEVFGPLMAVYTVKDESEAIQVANHTQFGLGASIWTQDVEKARRMTQKIKAGSVFVNSMMKSDPAVPFGGVKKSGYGRELSHFGMREFVNIQTMVIG